jgi:hypothetical protein
VKLECTRKVPMPYIQEKNREEFKTCRKGLHTYKVEPSKAGCSECRNAYQTFYREKHKETAKVKQKKYYNINREAILAKDKRWHETNPEEARRINKNSKLKSTFGIDSEQYNSMLKLQSNVCAICKEPEKVLDYRSKLLKALAVDHSRKTGKIRGLLCGSCNRAIGYLRDDPQLCRATALYLEINGDVC